jgi:hypothetical protein
MVMQERTLSAGLSLCNDTEQYCAEPDDPSAGYGRTSSPERSILPLCCVPATDGNSKKERGIVSQQ